jgi:hypothetical protein
MTMSERFGSFAAIARAEGSPLYAEWASGVARDDAVLELLERAHPSKRQPVLVFAVWRLLGAAEGSYDELREWVLDDADGWLAELGSRLTQTNDVRRTAPVALALAAAGIDAPVALLEVGASAGLDLHLDAYSVEARFGSGVNRVLGDPDSIVRLGIEVENAETTAQDHRALPRIAHRAGLDLAPLDVGSPADALWLETLLWPGQTDRVELLRAAIEVARRDPANIVAGDAVDGLDTLVSGVPAGVVPVVVTAGTLVYLPGRRRQAFVDEVARLGVRWISYEKTGLLEGIDATLRDPAQERDFATLALDGRALGLGDAHGTRLRWV